MKRFVKLLVIVLAVAALTSAMALASSAEYGSCGTNLTYTLDSEGTLTIRGTGAMSNYSSSSSVPWYSNRGSIKTVVIGSGVTSIGKYAFYDCTSLTSVTIPDSVTSIGNYAFYYCYSLTSVTIPDSVTSIREYTFYGCSSLTNVTIPDSVTSIGENAFQGCSGLTSVTIPDSVTSIGSSAFKYCRSLTSVTIPDSVTSIGSGAFDSCTSLTSVTIGSGVTSIGGGAFNGCSSLTSMTIPFVGNTKNGTSNTYFGYIFGANSYSNNSSYVPSSLKDVVITGGTSIGEYAFFRCSSLTSVTIGNSVTSIGYEAFYNCSRLTSVTIGNSVTSIGEAAFRGCNSLTIATIPDSVTSIGDDAFYDCENLLYNTYCNADYLGNSSNPYVALIKATSTTISSCSISPRTKAICNEAFSGCSGLTSVTIPDSVTSIGNYAFYNCSSLAEILVNENNPNYSSEDGILYNKAKTELICYPGGKTGSVMIPDSVTSIGWRAFANCSGFSSVTIPNSVTDIGWASFFNCSSLTSVTIGNSVKSIGKLAFYNCSFLTSVTIGNSVTSIDDDAFKSCYKLVEVINHSKLSITVGSSGNGYVAYYAKSVHSGSSRIVEQDEYLFYSYNGTAYLLGYTGSDAELTLPNKFQGGSYQINQYAFSGCTSLESVTIPGSVTSIGTNAFTGCNSLNKMTIPFVGQGKYITTNAYLGYLFGATSYLGNASSIPASLKEIVITNSVSIEDFAFSDCVSLTNITILDSVTNISGSAFTGCTSLEKLTIPFVGETQNGTVNTHFGYIFGASSYTNNSSFVPASLKEVVVTGGGIIDSHAFENCSNLSKLTIGNDVMSIGTAAFSGCTELTGVYISDIGTWCSIAFTDAISNPLYFARDLYLNGELVTSLLIPEDVTSIGKYSFYGCDSLTSITIPNSVSNLGQYAFADCIALENVIIGNSIDTIGEHSFSGCSALRDVTIVGYGLKTVGAYAFADCTALVNVSIPDTTIEIRDYAFSNCASLEEFVIPDSVAKIGSYAFRGCSRLANPFIPESVSTAGSGIFYDCTSITDVYCEAASRPSGWDTTWKNGIDAEIHWGSTDTTTVLFGDLNGDGTVSINDVTVLLLVLAGRYNGPTNAVAAIPTKFEF